MPGALQVIFGYGASDDRSFTAFSNPQSAIPGRTGTFDLAKSDSRGEISLRANQIYFLDAELITYVSVDEDLRRISNAEFQGLVSLLADPVGQTWKLKFPEGVEPLKINAQLSPRRESWQSFLEYSYRNIDRSSSFTSGWRPPFVTTAEFGHRFTITDSAGVETDYDVIYKRPAIQHTYRNVQRYGQSKVTTGARPFDFASNRVFALALGDTQTPDDHNLPTGTVLATGDIFVDNEALGFYDLVPLDLDGMPFSGSGNAFRLHVFPARRWRYDGADWVLDATIAFNGTNLGDTHIDSDLTVWTPLWNSTTWLVEWVEIENVELSDVPTASITVDTLAAAASPTVTGSADGDIFISTYDYPPDPTMPVTANIVAGDPPITAFNFDHRYWRWDSTNLEWVFQQWLFGVPQTYDNFLTIMNEALDGVATAVWYDSEDFTYPYIFVLCNEIGINVSISLRDLNSRDIPGIRAFRDFQARRWHDESGGPHGEFNDYGGRWTSYAPSYGSGSIDVYTGDWSRVGVVSADDQSVLWQFEKDTDNPTDRNFPIIHETRLSTVDMHGNAQMIDDFVIGAEVAASSLGLGGTVDELNLRTAALEAKDILQDAKDAEQDAAIALLNTDREAGIFVDARLDSLITFPRYTSKTQIEQLFSATDDLPPFSDTNYNAVINAASIKVEAYIKRESIYSSNKGLARFANTVIPPEIDQRFPNINNRDANQQVIIAATYFGIAEIFNLRGETSVRDLDTNTVTETQSQRYTRMAKEILGNLMVEAKKKGSLSIGSAQLATPSNQYDYYRDNIYNRQRTRRGGKAINAFVAGAENTKPLNLLQNPQFLIFDHPLGWDFRNANEDIATITSQMLDPDYFPPRQDFDSEIELLANKAASRNIYITDLNSIKKTTPAGGEKFQFTHYPFIPVMNNGIYRAEFNLKALTNLTTPTNFYLKILSVDETVGTPTKTTIAMRPMQAAANSQVSLVGDFTSDDTPNVITNKLPEDHTHFQAFVVSETNLSQHNAIEILSPSITFNPFPEEQETRGDGYATF